MHAESLELMKGFVGTYIDNNFDENVLDVGSFDVNGSYRELFNHFEAYTGVDIVEGPNVDKVVPAGLFSQYLDKYDIVVSGNTIEHCINPFSFIEDIDSVLKSGGYCCIITPTKIDIHSHPIDCWRILPDGMKILFKHVGWEIEVCEIYKGQHDDCIGIARKP